MEQRDRRDEWSEEKFEKNSALTNTENKTKETLQALGMDQEKLSRLAVIWTSAFKNVLNTDVLVSI